MKHTIIIGAVVIVGLGAWAGTSGCEITGAGIGLHDVEEGGECVDDDDCKRGTCYEDRCKTAAGGGACSEFQCKTDGECCSGFCNGSYCEDSCGMSYDSCDSSSDCCSGYSCNDGYCESGSTCASNGSVCDFDEECCSGTCDELYGCTTGSSSCGGSEAFCTDDADCCSDLCLSSLNECY